MLQLRLFLWTSALVDQSISAEVSHLTVRGMVMVKSRFQISMPVVCDEVVTPIAGTVPDSGPAVLAALRSAAAQSYPCKLQDVDGDWHLVTFQPPYPLEAVSGFQDRKTGKRVLYRVANVMLVEVDALSANGALQAWAAG